MKKLTLTLVMVAVIGLAFGQKNVRQSASNYLKSGKLDKAVEAINTCVQDASTSRDAKSWMLRGHIYLEIYDSKIDAFKALDADPVPKALESYKNAVSFDPKKEYYDEIFAKVNWMRDQYYNKAVDNYNNKDFKSAMENFGRSADVLEIVNFKDTTSLLNAAACATLADEKESAIVYYKKLINANYKTANLFVSMSDTYRQLNDSANALAAVRQGQKEFPADNRLFLAETNIYLTFNDTEKALKNLRQALVQDPENYTVAFALGTIHDNIANDNTKPAEVRSEAFNSAVEAYKNSLKIKPDYFDGCYNLGALYVNKAAGKLDEANNLPVDATEKYEKLTGEANELLGLALPYLEKASELQPADLNTLFSLKQIYTRTHQNDKAKMIQEKINEIQK